MMSRIETYLLKNTKAAPLAVFRIFFGLLMLASLVRFWANGWIYEVYIVPDFFFKFYGFEWVVGLGEYTYVLFILAMISCVGISLGYKYRLSSTVFFLSFTYIELIDKTTYLNHYYFISIISFVLIFLPAHVYYSVDAKQKKSLRASLVPQWTIDILKVLLGIVYFYAGIAKINSDWLLRAMPMRLWLPSKYDLPVLGYLCQQEYFHYLISWSGMLYDVFIVFLLWNKKTRKLAYVLVVVFHLLTSILFPSIGMFPYIMIVATLIFFEAKVPLRILKAISKLFKISMDVFETNTPWHLRIESQKLLAKALGLFIVFQLLFPFRYLLYPGELFWTEEGYRFSWRVMLIEKVGMATFKVVDNSTGKFEVVANKDYLTGFQEKQMTTQSDFILEFAHHLKEIYTKKGYQDISVYVESYVTLNGRLSQAYIDPKVDLIQEKETLQHKHWIIPYNYEIKGF